MRWKACGVTMIGSLLAMGALLWVPLQQQVYWWGTEVKGRNADGTPRLAGTSSLDDIRPAEDGLPFRWGWIWTRAREAPYRVGDRVPKGVLRPAGFESVQWLLVFAEIGLIVAGCGGALTVLVIRMRRRGALTTLA